MCNNSEQTIYKLWKNQIMQQVNCQWSDAEYCITNCMFIQSKIIYFYKSFSGSELKSELDRQNPNSVNKN